MSRYRVTPVVPADVHAYGLHVPAGGLVVVVAGDGPGAGVDRDTLQLLDRDPAYRVEPVPAPDTAPAEPPPAPRSGRRR